jgi:hypothetical protein
MLTSSIAVMLVTNPDRYRSGFVAWHQRTVESTATRTDQLIVAGSQGGPLSQGWVANAPTAGAGVQTAVLTRCRKAAWPSRAMAGVASAAAAISAADRSLRLVISISPLDMKANDVGSTTEMEQRSTYQSNIFSRRFNAARGRRVASFLTLGHQGDYRP